MAGGISLKKWALLYFSSVMMLPGWAGAEIVEITLHVPVHLRLQQTNVEQNLVVTIVRETTQRNAPFALLIHGRTSNPQERVRMGQIKYPANSIWLVQHGFVVIVPTRVGYGLTGGPDLEYTGECQVKHYQEGVVSSVEEMQQLLTYLSQLPYIDSRRGIVIGESFGGLTALAMAASSNKAIIGVVNFSGGDGGDYSHLEEPCDHQKLAQFFIQAGKKNRLPTLWLYSLNDRFWGAQYPRQWYRGFTQAGGKGEFVQLPADKNNGHFIFNRNVLAWHTELERYFLQLGFALPATMAAHP